jgi:hypothetical protein
MSNTCGKLTLIYIKRILGRIVAVKNQSVAATGIRLILMETALELYTARKIQSAQIHANGTSNSERKRARRGCVEEM